MALEINKSHANSDMAYLCDTELLGPIGRQHTIAYVLRGCGVPVIDPFFPSVCIPLVQKILEALAEMDLLLTERPCPRSGIHPAHVYQRKMESYSCPGVAHDHEQLCCLEHGTHVIPHQGCPFR